MTHSRRAPYHLLVGSMWKHLENVAPGVPITATRPTSLFSTLGNTVYARVGPVAKRVWGFAFEWEDPEATRWLDYAASRPEREVWLLDENLAQINMLPVSATEGQSGVWIDVDGLTMQAFTSGETAASKVRGNVAHHLSFTTTAAPGATVGVYALGSTPIAIKAPDGVGPRRSSFSFVPDVDVDLAVQWTAANVVTAARLTVGSVDALGFLPSRGATPCRVLVGDGAATYKMAWKDRLSLSDSSYVLTEVG